MGAHNVGQENEEKEMKLGQMDAVFTIKDRLFCIPLAKQLLLEADSTMPDNPFAESIYKTECIVKRARKESLITQSISYVLDQITSGQRSGHDFSLRVFVGKGSGGNGRGVIDKAIAKNECGEILITWAEENIDLMVCDVALLRRWLVMHQNYRNDQSGDISWLATRKRSARSFFSFFEDVVFGAEFDDELDSAKAAHSALSGLLGKSPFVDRLAIIEKESKDELLGKPSVVKASHEKKPLSMQDIGKDLDSDDDAYGQKTDAPSMMRLHSDDALNKWIAFAQRTKRIWQVCHSSQQRRRC